MAFNKGATSDEFFFSIPKLDTRKFDNYDGFYISPAVSPYDPNYIYANAHHLISISLSIAAFVPLAYTIASFSHHCINGISGRNLQVGVNKISRFFLFKPDNIAMKTIEATTQLGGFNQSIPMRKSNKRFPYIKPHWHEDVAIITFWSSVLSHDGTTTVELIVGTKTLLTDVYAIGPKLGLDICQIPSRFLLQAWHYY